MTIPTKADIRNAGYRISANAADEIVSRCANSVKRDYLYHYVTDTDIASATNNSVLAQAWNSLTYVCYCQQYEFGTRTGGEKKRMDYGEHLSEMRAAKADAALALKALEETFPQKSKVVDSCEVYLRTQIFR